MSKKMHIYMWGEKPLVYYKFLAKTQTQKQNKEHCSVKCRTLENPGHLEWQSEETVLIEPVSEGSVVSSETTAFADGLAGVSVGTSANTTEFDTSDAVVSSGLAEFLSRPVRISSFTWNTSDSVGIKATLSPWYLFFNNANIKYKLNNFAFLRCNLKLKFVVNASPFYYGSMRACYQPLPGFKPSTIVAASNSELIPYSQQPGLWIKPQHSEGGELTLPFFYQRSYLKAQSGSDFTNMGTLRMIIYNVLQSANGVTGQGATVQVYAWAEDVILAGPSVGLALQADEYGVGPISGPASTVARIARAVKGIPIFGKFATATEMGANAVSGIAKLFGFTNVPVITEAQPLRPSPFPQLASPEIGYPVEKLTLDAKNELSVDPSILGLSAEDELAIENFVTKQSYLTSAAWTTATTVDTPLFTSKVTPHMCQVVGSVMQQTPLDVASDLFFNWRGDIIFTFRFIASPFHKGRVRISYDPFNAGVQTLGDTGPVTFNKVVDLSSETEVDIRIPYQQALAWQNKDTDPYTSVWTTSASPTITYDDTFDNGIISVKVLTLLTAPVATSTINMQVFVRGAENFELGNPYLPPQDRTVYQVQSDEYSEDRRGDTMEMGENDGSILIERNRINFGECVRSLRQLLRRSNFVDAYRLPSDTTLAGYFRYNHYRFPPHWGYDGAGISTVKGVSAPATDFSFSFARRLPWHVIANCFIAHRGSAHWHYNVEGEKPVSMYVNRNPNNAGGVLGRVSVTTSTYAYSTANQNAMAKFYATQGPFPGPGMALTNQKTQSGLSVSVPNYTQFKFQTTQPVNFVKPEFSGNTYDGSVYEGIQLGVEYTGAVSNPKTNLVSRYFAVGTDYNLHFFLNCPSLYILDQTAVVTA